MKIERLGVAVAFSLAFVLLAGPQTAQGTFLVGGQKFVEIFEDDFSGSGSGLDAAKWDTLIAGGASITRSGGKATVDAGASADDVFARTKAGALATLSDKASWGYEMAFTVNNNSSTAPLSNTNRQTFLTRGMNVLNDASSRDVGLFLTGSATGPFDLAWNSSKGTDPIDATLASGLTRGTQYTLGVYHRPDDMLEIYLNSSLIDTRASLPGAPPSSLKLGNDYGNTSVNMDLDSFKVGIDSVISLVDRTNGAGGSGTDPGIVYGGLADGVKSHSDRSYVYADVPDFLIGADAVQTFMSDDAGPNVNYAVTVIRQADLYVCVDARLSDNPPLAWMTDGDGPVFSDTGETVTITSRPFRIWLAGNLAPGTYNFEEQTSNNFYTIVARATIPEPSTLILLVLGGVGLLPLGRRLRRG